MTHKPCCDFFVASCVEDGGAYRYRLYEDGSTELLYKIPMPMPMYLTLNGSGLWAVLRAPFADSEDSGYGLYDPKDGRLLQEIRSTGGACGCHIAAKNGIVYVANYLGGSVFGSPDGLDVHTGTGPNPKRQAAPHPHSVALSPDGRHLLSCDLGLDAVFVYDRFLHRVTQGHVPPGAGPRHTAFSVHGMQLYCINEMGGSISTFAWDAPHLTLLDTISILPEGFTGVGSGSAIKASQYGKRLYATERASATIVTLETDGDRLSVLAHTDAMGKEPRDFTLLANERFAVCTNQFSDNLSLYRLDEQGIPQYLYSLPLPAPLCAIEIG